MAKVNFLFFLNSYNDICQSSAPSLNQFDWSRQITGVPFNAANSQQIQVLPGNTSPNLIPYMFSSPVNNASDAVLDNTDNLIITTPDTNISVGSLIVGSGIPVGTVVVSIAPTQYAFTVSAANATVGAVYSNNGHNFTVTATIVAGTTLGCTGTLEPQASGTLTLVSGTGDATITFSAFTESTAIVMSQDATASGTVALSFYDPAAFIYMESDQQLSVIYNNGSPVALNPFQINGLTVPGVFFISGPAYALTVTNPGTVTANVYLASMG